MNSVKLKNVVKNIKQKKDINSIKFLTSKILIIATLTQVASGNQNLIISYVKRTEIVVVAVAELLLYNLNNHVLHHRLAPQRDRVAFIVRIQAQLVPVLLKVAIEK